MHWRLKREPAKLLMLVLMPINTCLAAHSNTPRCPQTWVPVHCWRTAT